MSFVSGYGLSREKGAGEYIHTIMDSEFGEIKVRISTTAGGGVISLMAGVVKAYSERNLPVGKNLALATIFWSKTYLYSVKQITEWQDEHCSHFIDNEANWPQYAKERNEYLEKLLPLL